jgi:hypothetical protein
VGTLRPHEVVTGVGGDSRNPVPLRARQLTLEAGKLYIEAEAARAVSPGVSTAQTAVIAEPTMTTCAVSLDSRHPMKAHIRCPLVTHNCFAPRQAGLDKTPRQHSGLADPVVDYPVARLLPVSDRSEASSVAQQWLLSVASTRPAALT